MPFEFIPQDLEGVVLVHPHVFRDDRGWLLETFKRSAFRAAGIHEDFCQENFSLTAQGVLRGIHYQLPPHAQGKLVRVVRGEIWDVCVDLRGDSRTFGEWRGLTLTGEGHETLYIPPGIGHGFVALTEGAVVAYLCTAEHAPAAERGIHWNDPDLAIEWPNRDVTVSERDAGLPCLADAAICETEAP